jgi:CRISPR-associated protein Csd1
MLAADPQNEIPLFGYSITTVSFAAVLSAQGELVDISPLGQIVQQGKKEREIPLRLVVPAQIKRAASIRANFLCDTCIYALGLSDRDETDPSYAVYRFGAFKKKTFEILGDAKSSEAKAVLAFLEQYDPYAARDHEVIAAHLDQLLKPGRVVFKLEGASGYVHEHPEVRALWEQYLLETSNDNENVGQCLVTGETVPIARLHTNIKGIRGAAPTGSSLVTFNARAYESYNRAEAQGLNAPVGERAAFAYTTILNYLLSPEKIYHKTMIGPITVVYWAESTDFVYQLLLTELLNPGFLAVQENPPDEILAAADTLRHLCEGNIENMMTGLDPNMKVHVLGLLPNVSRLSIQFFHTDTFSALAKKFMRHYADMQIDKSFDTPSSPISIRWLLEETVSNLSKNKNASPVLTDAFVRAILNDAPYPASMYYALLNRIRADMDDTKKRIYKITHPRAALIKAYLIRKYREEDYQPFQNELTISLNQESVNPAYVLGRVFAIIEKVQKDAIGGELLRNRYFTAVCASPTRIFPALLKDLERNARKAPYGFKMQGLALKILRSLGDETQAIPEHFSLDEQGIFVLGYYHQRVAIFSYANASQETAVTEFAQDRKEKSG